MVPKDFDLGHKIMDEAHCSQYSIHPGTNKMYQYLKSFLWIWTKREIVQYVSECDTCRRVKADHLRPAGTLYLWAFPSGNGKAYACTSLCVCPTPRMGNTWYWSLWIAWLSWPLYTHIYDIQGQTVCWALHVIYCPLSWYPKNHYL
jgi:hypothetical protein